MKMIRVLALFGAVAALSACSQTVAETQPTTTKPAAAVAAPVLTPAVAATPAPIRVAPKGTKRVAEAQASLKSAGFDPGPLDGVAGKKTRAAVRAFQQAKGLKANGMLDRSTLAALKG